MSDPKSKKADQQNTEEQIQQSSNENTKSQQIQQKTTQDPKTFTPLRFITNLAGSLTAISAVLAVAGVLVLRSHSDMLGISHLAEYELSDYIYEGGMFFLKTLMVLATGSPLYITSFLLVFGLFYSCKVYSTPSEEWEIKLQGVKDSWYSPFWRTVFILVAMVAMVPCIYLLATDIDVKDVIYLDSEHSFVSKKIVQGTDIPTNYYWGLLFSIVSLFCIYWIYRTKTILRSQRKTQPHFIQEFPFEIGAFLITLFLLVIAVLLPVNYGRNVYPNSYHSIGYMLLEGDALDENLKKRLQYSFVEGEIATEELIQKFADNSKTSKYLKNLLNSVANNQKITQKNLIEHLNKLIEKESLYNEKMFDITLRDKTLEFTQKKYLNKKERKKLNRLLLEDLYPNEIQKRSVLLIKENTNSYIIYIRNTKEIHVLAKNRVAYLFLERKESLFK